MLLGHLHVRSNQYCFFAVQHLQSSIPVEGNLQSHKMAHLGDTDG